ncbi:MAG: hypothetical protein P4L83_21125 [Nevskia sp.]|nr:hypothetical protein [Nevskia sp.]
MAAPLLGAGDGSLDISLLAGLHPLMTFSRASTATYMRAGTILSAAAGAPRFETDVAGNPLGVLSDTQSQNLAVQSVPGATGWGYFNTSNVPGAAADPSGGVAAEAVSDTATNAAHTFYHANLSFVSGTTYTQSIFVKAGTASLIQIAFPLNAFGANAYANFNISTGTWGTVGSAATALPPVQLANGWWRIGIYATATATIATTPQFATINSPTAANIPSYVGTGSTIYIWGLQVETGVVMTAYIPTSGSAVTRAADNLSLPLAVLPQLQSGVGYTFAFECDLQTNTPSNYRAVFGVDDASGFTNALYATVLPNGQFAWGGPIASLPNFVLPAVGTVLKTAFSINRGEMQVQAALNGAIVAPGALSNLPVFTNVGLMQAPPPWGSGATELGGHTRRVRAWPRVLSAAELAQVTT